MSRETWPFRDPGLDLFAHSDNRRPTSWDTQAVWTVTTFETAPAPAEATCAYCGRQRPAGRETCLGCGAGEVEP